MMRNTWITGALACAVSTIGLAGCLEDDSSNPGESRIHHYRIRTVDLPDTYDEVDALGLDLDDDGFADNKLGHQYQGLRASYTSYGVEDPAATRLGSDVGWMLTLVEDGDGVGAAVTIGRYDADGVLLAPWLDELDLARGDGLDASDVLRGGTAELPLGTLGDALGDAAPAWLRASRVAIRVDAWDRDAATVTLGVGVWDVEATAALFPDLAAYFSSKLSDPDAAYAHQLDLDGDGTITVEEIAAGPLIAASFAPDLDNHELSFGLRLGGRRYGP